MMKVKPLYLPAPYQEAAHYGRLILRDGTTANLRVSLPQDRDAMVDFIKGLSLESRLMRFFSHSKPGMEVIDPLCDSSNPDEAMTLIVSRTIEGEDTIIGTASYFAVDKKTAEFAVVVDDKFQKRGIGSLLLERLSLLAISRGFVNFTAVTHVKNKPMLEVFHNSGFEMTKEWEAGYITLKMTVLPGQESVQRSELRDLMFTTASLRPFFKPESVAVVGASRNPASIGYRIMEALVSNRFQGPIYPVNPKAKVVSSIKCCPTVDAIPEPVDLAVIAVPKELVLTVVDDCARRGVRALVVISAGFSEVGAEGKRLQDSLVQKARGYGMRLIGPNCLGILNTDPLVRLNASFSPVFPPEGKIAMASQSGALGLAILALAKRRDLGLSMFVSIGNKADISGNDLLQYWEEDPGTDVVLLYLEAFKNPRRFARIARRFSRKKPIICIKGGRSDAGMRAAGSHTAALAGSDVPVEALFSQTGVIRSESLEEMFDIAAAMACQPRLRNNRIGIVTNAGGPGILCADACETNGLVVESLPEDIQKNLAAFLPSAAGVSNPVDMIASAPPEHYRKTIEMMLSSDSIDGLIVIYIPVGLAEDEDILKAISDGVSDVRSKGIKDKPVIAVPMIWDREILPLKTKGETIPTCTFPESAAKVFSRMYEYSCWRNVVPGNILDFEDVSSQRAREICQRAIKQRGKGWLSASEVMAVLKCFGLPVPEGGVATTPDEAASIANSIGYPVVIKLDSTEVVHKTDVGGVFLNIDREEGVRKAFATMQDNFVRIGKPDAMAGVLVQPMVKGGIEVMIGVTEDPIFGPLIAFGLGGIHVDIMKDVVFRVTPLTDHDASTMIREIRGFKLLEGFRSYPPADIKSLEEILLRISLMIEEIPEIKELDLNPISAMAPGQGCVILDARIRVEPFSEEQPIRYKAVPTGE
ncbi:MAG: GNAT family N-acetyltransferase [Methanoregula sp. SKADARSKE-2]|nr:MAG: GNAT family N-acetyltransferase [Methanoregula sp. SKADARSKE-2]